MKYLYIVSLIWFERSYILPPRWTMESLGLLAYKLKRAVIMFSRGDTRFCPCIPDIYLKLHIVFIELILRVAVLYVIYFFTLIFLLYSSPPSWIVLLFQQWGRFLTSNMGYSCWWFHFQEFPVSSSFYSRFSSDISSFIEGVWWLVALYSSTLHLGGGILNGCLFPCACSTNIGSSVLISCTLVFPTV